MEFGVAEAHSFRWWLKNNTNPNSRFFGFDTFEGLPEDWGGYDKGDMAAAVPQTDDTRAAFFKGLFQDTLIPFLEENSAEILNKNKIRIFHLDADLYSATAFTLSQVARYLKKGDILLFDEFSVPMHEFKAYDEFVNNYSIKLKPVAAVNNFYQIAFVVE